MFVVRDLLIQIQDATNIFIKTETKTLGRHTVASTAVPSKHLFSESRSDLPSLFNFNPFIMRDSMDNKCLADGTLSDPQFLSFIEKFLQFQTTEDYQARLWQMFAFALASDDFDVLTAADRSALAGTYHQLNQLLGSLTNFKSK